MAGNEFDSEPLYEDLHTIRLLRIPWGKDSSKFDVYLSSFALNSASCPKYVVLSYTWGPTEHARSININGHPFDVLPNLYSFLKLTQDLPEFSTETWWWIDSICINQKDEYEKGSQIEIMGKIYERAHKTVVWLGEEIEWRAPESSKDCKGAIKNLYRLCDEIDKATRADMSLDQARLLKLREPQSGLDWKAVERLLLRPWWRRVWTLQEYLISNNLKFYCGKERISRRNLQDAIYAAWICKAWDGVLIDRSGFYSGWNRRRMNQWYENRKNEMGLIALMAYVGDSEATVEQDRVYSLLGVARDADLVHGIDPTSTVEEVYSKLVSSFIDKYNSLDIICYSHVFNHSARNLDSSTKLATNLNSSILPSWVPDWRARVEGKVIPVMASQGSTKGTGNFRPAWVKKSEATYNASVDTKPSFHISEGNKVLACMGVILDKIDGLGGSKYNDAGDIVDEKNELSLEQSTSEHNIHFPQDTTPVSTLMATVSRCIALDREDRYLAEAMTSNLFQADFEKFCKAYFTNPTKDKIPVKFLEWFTTNKELVIQGRTLEEHSREGSGNAPVLGWRDLREGPTRTFYGRLGDTAVTMARRLVVTEKGYLGMAASRARKGDLVCVLFGCSIPVILRELDGDGNFVFMGECYLDGFMNGEALDEEKGLEKTWFHIL